MYENRAKMYKKWSKHDVPKVFINLEIESQGLQEIDVLPLSSVTYPTLQS